MQDAKRTGQFQTSNFKKQNKNMNAGAFSIFQNQKSENTMPVKVSMIEISQKRLKLVPFSMIEIARFQQIYFRKAFFYFRKSPIIP